MPSDSKDEQIAILRERVARLETRLEELTRALTLGTEMREKTKERVQSLFIGIVGIALTAIGTLVGFLVHLSRGG